ncbi:MAG TPA: efflux RND transporter periplasmic adaptor subunit, partial [Gemmataceae bacterium]|nr:efflux RND transporter periplasmic adaptor subunit [Gemmataceae bacterium]
MKKLLFAMLVLAGLAGGVFWFMKSKAQPGTSFTVAEVRRGRLEATVGSTGTLQPREIVDVGAQVVGRIIFIGRDPSTQSKIVDWGSEVQGPELDQYGKVVKPGTLLAQIDPELYEAQVLSAEAAVASTQAAVKSAEAAVDAAKADLLQKTATLTQATNDWDRAQRLIKTDGVSRAEYDQFHAAYGVAQANVKSSTANIEVTQANLKKAQADVKTAQATLRTAQTNLAYTKITAPVKGVVIDRRVNVGQTVVASLSAPSLFLIAKDLSKTEVWATVNEVDVGKIKIDPDPKRRNVKFTVDAYPGRVYHGRVVPQGKLPFRLNATMNQNVVTYTVVVSVDDEENKEGDLRPYMTANLTFLVGEKDNALLVPNAALRWQPARNQIAPEVRDAYARIRGKKRSAADPEALDRGLVWVKGDDGYVRFIEVRTGLSDSVSTEILGVLNG